MVAKQKPVRAEYRDRDTRLNAMNTQGLEAVWMFPTMAVGVEAAMRNDLKACLATLRAFNRWLDDDWGLKFKNRIYAAPIIPLTSVDWAVEELEWALARGARVITLRNGPVFTSTGTCSPGAEKFDPFWARVQDAGVTVATHLADDGYDFISDMWEPDSSFWALRNSPLKKIVVSCRAVTDFYGAMICHRVFERFPRLRLASVANGTSWVRPLLSNLRTLHTQHKGYWKDHPFDQFVDHVSVTPCLADKIDDIAWVLPAERILFGSDWPHIEGGADPLDSLGSLRKFNAKDLRKIMRDNTEKLTRGV
jgi:predicted TIM-barrel fold metal-dependent hydrolase